MADYTLAFSCSMNCLYVFVFDFMVLGVIQGISAFWVSMRRFTEVFFVRSSTKSQKAAVGGQCSDSDQGILSPVWVHETRSFFQPALRTSGHVGIAFLCRLYDPQASV
jgi:hypothetical protein